LGSEGIFISYSVLDEYDCCCIVYYWSQRLGNGGLVESFVNADDVVVVPSCVTGVVDH
jgi:hypothetical protein